MEELQKLANQAFIAKTSAAMSTTALTTLVWVYINELNVWSTNAAIGVLYYAILTIITTAFGIIQKNAWCKWNYRLTVFTILCARICADVKMCITGRQVESSVAAIMTLAVFAIATHRSYSHVRASYEGAKEENVTMLKTKQSIWRAQEAKKYGILTSILVFVILWIATSDINVWNRIDSGITYYAVASILTLFALVLFPTANTERKVNTYQQRANFRYACVGIATIGCLRATTDLMLSIVMKIEPPSIIGPAVTIFIFAAVEAWASLSARKYI